MFLHLVLWTVSFLLWEMLFVTAFCAYMYPFGTVGLVVIFLLFHVIWSFAVASLYATALTEPAPIPSRYKLPDCIFTESNVARKVALWARSKNLPVDFVPTDCDGDVIDCPPFCVRCKTIKPIRTHHCRRCARCILRMDHHCPIIGRCIHMHNHKYFLLFLFWSTMLSFYGILCAVPALIYRRTDVYQSVKVIIPAIFFIIDPGDHFNRDYIIPICLVASGVVNALVCGTSLCVFLVQLACALLRNWTTLELRFMQPGSNNDGRFVLSAKRYDHTSTMANFRAIFGEDPLLWLLPIPTTYGDGSFSEYMENKQIKKQKNL